MNILNIKEREIVNLEEQDYVIAKKMKENNPSLPFSIIDNNKLSFEDYIVGSIKINDTLINIVPRHSYITLLNVFEMILYTEFDFFLEKSSGYAFDLNSGVFIIPHMFASSCSKLTKFGLTGDFLKEISQSSVIDGRIIFDDYNKKLFAHNGLRVEKNIYTKNILANQIIKTALSKVLRLVPDNNELKYFLTYFEDVDYCSDEYKTFNPDSFFSTNPHYKECLSISLIILKNMYINFVGNDVEWLSFLSNSNDLFEKYARKLVKNALDIPVEKWAEAKKFAYLEYNGIKGYKSYIPDIVINYDKRNNACFAILDVKNKELRIQDNDVSTLIQSADLYQMLFYSQKLKSNRCGLIYPSNKFINPIKVIVSDIKDLDLFLLTINMTVPQKQRLSKLKEDLNNYLFYNC